MCRFLDQQSGRELLFVTVHLARGKPEIRQEQARGLRNWARDQALPIIAAGDFNFDANFKQKTINHPAPVLPSIRGNGKPDCTPTVTENPPLP